MLATGRLNAPAVFPYSNYSSHVFLHWTFGPQIWDQCALLELGNNQLVMQHNQLVMQHNSQLVMQHNSQLVMKQQSTGDNTTINWRCNTTINW
jgi:hypothetical protein